MIRVRPTLDTEEAILDVIKDVRHLPIENIFRFLAEHYIMDLDALKTVLDVLENAGDTEESANLLSVSSNSDSKHKNTSRTPAAA